jgi:hypothetical protein
LERRRLICPPYEFSHNRALCWPLFVLFMPPRRRDMAQIPEGRLKLLKAGQEGH